MGIHHEEIYFGRREAGGGLGPKHQDISQIQLLMQPSLIARLSFLWQIDNWGVNWVARAVKLAVHLNAKRMKVYLPNSTENAANFDSTAFIFLGNR